MAPLTELPQWLVLGLALGALASLGITVVFSAGLWLFPTGPRSRGRQRESRREAEIGEYFDAIDEPYVEDYSIDGQTVAFYLPNRDVAVTFDARTYYRLARSSTQTVLVEHELPGVHLGHRLPFETPAPPDGHGRGVPPAYAAFAILDVPPTADRETVRRAYREKVKDVHPDHGGDTEEFQRVREAYTTAKQYTRGESA